MSARRVSSTACSGAITAALLAGCASDPTPSQATLSIVTGRETGALTAIPTPTRLLVSMRTGTAAAATIVDLAWPTNDFDLGTLDASTEYAFTAELRDATGAAVLRGETPVVSGAEVGANGLTMLIGRVGLSARPNAGLSHAWPTPVAATIGRYAFVASPDGDTSELYDFVALASLAAKTSLPRRPVSLVSGDGQHLLLVDASSATMLDVSAGTSTDADLGGISPTDLAGGSAVLGEDGTYFVGATRDSGTATRAVIRLGTDGSIHAVSLATPRVRAWATWAPGAGLVVGGGAIGASLEVLAASAVSFSPLGASYGGSGGAAVALGDGTVVVVGGTDDAGAPRGPARLTLACGASCAPAVLEGSFDLARGAGYTGSTGHGVVVGATADGTTTMLRATATAMGVTLEAAPLRTARRGAASLALGDGYVAVLGGSDAGGAPVSDVEIFIPP